MYVFLYVLEFCDVLCSTDLSDKMPGRIFVNRIFKKIEWPPCLGLDVLLSRIKLKEKRITLQKRYFSKEIGRYHTFLIGKITKKYKINLSGNDNFINIIIYHPLGI
jgi:hypothetical protein